MFERPTVFIVGAGGSVEFGFPTGDSLKTAIGNKVDIIFDREGSLGRGDGTILDAVTHLARHKGERDRMPYITAGRWLASAMPQAISIDNFLHTHSESETVVTMGKLGIAACILEAEAKSPILNRQDRHQPPDYRKLPLTWHNLFGKMLLEGFRPGASDVFENVSFITFNYDRCIEHYLLHFIQNYFGMDIGKAQEITAALEVIHPYGQVGQLPWRLSNIPKIEFGGPPDVSQLLHASRQIMTFTERIEDEEMMGRIRELVGEAEVVVYLGFSYGDMNMDLLSLKESGDIYKHVFGTAYGMSDSNIQSVKKVIYNSMGPSPHLNSTELAKLKCHELFNDYWRAILRP